MDKFLDNKSVSGGLMSLLDLFCFINKYQSPIRKDYIKYERVSFEDWLCSLKYINRQCDQEVLSLEIAKIFSLNHIGVFYYMSKACQDFNDYLDVYINYNKIWHDYDEKKKYLLNGLPVISWEPTSYSEIRDFADEIAISQEFQVAIFYRKTLQILSRPVQVFSKIEFATPEPCNIQTYEDFFDCTVTFGAEKTQIFFSTDVIDVVFDEKDALLFGIVQKCADDMIQQLTSKNSFMSLVNRGILDSIKNQQPQIEYVAKYLDISTVHLQKKLKEKDVNFKLLLTEVRLDLAKAYLKETNLSMTDISSLLCYKEQTSFNRAFKIGTGKSPTEWRRA